MFLILTSKVLATFAVRCWTCKQKTAIDIFFLHWVISCGGILRKNFAVSQSLKSESKRTCHSCKCSFIGGVGGRNNKWNHNRRVGDEFPMNEHHNCGSHC